MPPKKATNNNRVVTINCPAQNTPKMEYMDDRSSPHRLRIELSSTHSIDSSYDCLTRPSCQIWIRWRSYLLPSLQVAQSDRSTAATSI